MDWLHGERHADRGKYLGPLMTNRGTASNRKPLSAARPDARANPGATPCGAVGRSREWRGEQPKVKPGPRSVVRREAQG